MLRFSVFQDGKAADRVDLTGAYLVGNDGVPIRAEIEFKQGEIRCRKRVAGPAGLALLWPVPEVGRILLETARVPERDKPYVLQVELLRGRLMRIAQKREDWGLDENGAAAQVGPRVEQSRDLLIEALKAVQPGEAAALAERALMIAVSAGEELSRVHAGSLLERRRPTTPSTARRVFGAGIDLKTQNELYLKRLVASCDFVAVPFSWRLIEPAEQRFDWKELDTWVEWLVKRRIPIKGCDLISFTEENVPDWVYIWEHDFDTIRDLIYEHVRRVIGRYGNAVQAWDVVSGVHATNCLSFNFEELMELTRMCAAITKQLAPRATAVIDLVAPWGEYYAQNPRTIPPLLYADMILQGGINFDAFGLQLRFGGGPVGTYPRDMFQVSAVLDRFNLGKPLHITAVGVPSATEGAETCGTTGSLGERAWIGAWSEATQARWLKEFFTLALSKSFIDTVTWRPFSDRDACAVGHCGLLRNDFTPKPAYDELIKLRSQLSKPAVLAVK